MTHEKGRKEGTLEESNGQWPTKNRTKSRYQGAKPPAPLQKGSISLDHPHHCDHIVLGSCHSNVGRGKSIKILVLLCYTVPSFDSFDPTIYVTKNNIDDHHQKSEDPQFHEHGSGGQATCPGTAP